MHTKATFAQSAAKQYIVHLSILLTIGLAVGIYLIGTTIVIAKDGVGFIEYAVDLEAAPAQAIRAKAQHPGYPFLILMAHRIVQAVNNGSLLASWVHSAQAAALVFRLLAVGVIYLLGRVLVGPGHSFLATLILILFPLPAEYGSDALSDWPALFFLSAGLLLAMRGAAEGKWWMFGLAGLLAGAGYLVRPECVQLIVYAFSWLILQLFWSKRGMTRGRLALALVVLLVGFCAAAVPYMRFKGAVFPKKDLVQFASGVRACDGCQAQLQSSSRSVCAAGVTPAGVAEGARELFAGVGETVMWFYMPPLIIGVCSSLKRRTWLHPQQFFIIVLIALNVGLLLWLNGRYGYMSRRHTLPLVAFCTLYVPAGLQIMASWLCGRIGLSTGRTFASDGCNRLLFFILLVVGICVCTPKLLRPLHHDKVFLRATARWLAANTDIADVIAVPDVRIGFYSQRKVILCDGDETPEEARYVVDVPKRGRSVLAEKEGLLAEKTIIGDDGMPKATVYSRQP